MKYTVNVPDGPLQFDSADSIRTAFKAAWIRESNIIHPDDGSEPITVKQYFENCGEHALLAEQESIRFKAAATPQGSGKNRLEEATGLDIIISLILPGWGIIVGLIALLKGERKRAGTMIGIGFVIGIVIFLAQQHR